MQGVGTIPEDSLLVFTDFLRDALVGVVGDFVRLDEGVVRVRRNPGIMEELAGIPGSPDVH